MRYNNYHKHTHYSNIRTLDVICKPEDYMKRAQELGHTIYFTTEHGFQGNLYEAQTLCEKYGLKPVYGVEAYYVDNIEDKTDRRNFHIMLIGMTEKARYEINKIISIANEEGFYYKPRIGLKELLSLTPSDTIVTTACVASRLFKNKVADSSEDDRSWYYDFFKPVKDHFGDNFYLEVQNHNDIKQIEFNKKILALSKKTNTKIIHANDSHYIYPEDAKDRDLFLRAKEMNYEEESGFVLDYPDSDEILRRYKEQGVLTEEEALEALSNTLIFDKAEPIYTDKEFKIPLVPNSFIKEELGEGYSNDDNDKVLRGIINNEYKKRLKAGKLKEELIPKYKKEIINEVETVRQCGMASYFVLDHMVVNRAVNKYGAVLTRSGRGSGVSFIINNFLGLTEVDRIKAPVKLYPSRFMSAERILNSRSLPDIDLNFADVKPVIKATKDILGEDGIYYMVAYKPLQRSSAFRLWCKGLGYNIQEYDEVAKLLANKNISDEDFVSQNPNWKDQLEGSKRFRGVIEAIAPSPCSFLLSNDPISEKIGLIKIEGEICCALDGYNCDVYKYLKNDYLTVSVYNIISNVYKMIGRPIDDIPTLVNNCDDKVWDIYAKGLTTSINQADSDMAKRQLMEYKPRELAELTAWAASIRPGFASLLDKFLNREEYSTGVKELDDLLSDSYHYMLYQESIMAFLVWLGIEEKGTYDIIKKIAKKKFTQEELDGLKAKLESNWIKNMGNKNHFDENWQVVQDAASYSFNASHALSVAIDSLYGAYLKSHYPMEYFTYALIFYTGDIKKTANLTDELSSFGIRLEPIKFRKSGAVYTMDKENNIIYKGIQSIKYMNEDVGNQLYEMRDKHFNNFFELIEAFPGNARQLEILIELGFFSEFGKAKRLKILMGTYEKFYGKKIVKKDDNPFGTDLVLKYSPVETAKQYRFENGIPNEMLLEACENVPDENYPLGYILQKQQEYLGYIEYKDENLDDSYYIVTDFKTYKNKNKPYVTLYRPKDGELIKTKVFNGNKFSSDPFCLYSILKIERFYTRFKSKFVDGNWVNTEEQEDVIDDYTIINRGN